jgi:perosamine synthetase
MFKIPFAGRSHQYEEDEINAVSELMRGVEPLTQGPHLKAFEEAFKEFLKSENHCFGVGCAADALEIAASLLNLGPEDEIIIPAHTYTASAMPFAKRGVKIVWADIDLETRVVTAETITPLITPKTRAVLVVHLYGYAADMPEIASLAKMYDLVLIEDCAQSIGSEVAGVKTGAWSDISIFSFHAHKNITTLGEGGMLTVKRDDWASIIPAIRHNGHANFIRDHDNYWLPAMSDVILPDIDGDAFMPSNYCLNEVAALLGQKLLKRVDKINDFKRQRAISFISALSNYNELSFHYVESKRHNYHLLVAEACGIDRDKFISAMALNHGIQCIVQYYPLYRYNFYQQLGYGNVSLPNTDRFFDNMISFPFHFMLEDKDLDQIINAVKKTL